MLRSLGQWPEEADDAAQAPLAVELADVQAADRVDALGGTLAFESPPGGGTRVSARIPTVSDPAAA